MRDGAFRVLEGSFRMQRTRSKSHVSVTSLKRALTGGLFTWNPSVDLAFTGLVKIFHC